jgi:hypothetical protein
MGSKLIARGYTGSATAVVSSGFLFTLIKRVGRTAKNIYDSTANKIREYYVTAMLIEVNEDELIKPISGTEFGEVNNKKINTNAILIKINHMKLFIERIFISAGNKIGVRRHKKNLKDYRRKL